MSTPLDSYWEPIEPRFDFPLADPGIDDKDHMDKNRRRKIIADPQLQYSLMNSLIIVFLLASGIFFGTMSFAFLEVQTTIESLQLPQNHQVFSDLRQIENAVALVFVAIVVGFAVLVIWGGRYLVGQKDGVRQEFSASEI